MKNICPHCKAEMPEEASFCLKCMTPRSIEKAEFPNKKSKTGIYAAVIISFLVIIATALIIIAYPRSQNLTAATTNQIQRQAVTETNPTTNITKVSSTVSTTKATKLTTTETTEKTSESTQTTEETTETTAETTTETTTVTKKEATTASTKIIYNGDTLVEYPSSRKDKSFTVPYSVKKISNGAFSKNKHLKTIKFSKREKLECDWAKLYSNLPELKTVYVYPGTDADLIGLQYFDGEIVYYD